MSSYSQPQLRPPQDWQTFERASTTLWEHILDDPHLTRFGRQGQAQHGLDITGYRNGDTGRLVGIQCKCIRHPGNLEEEVVREDLRKAAQYVPQLSEYIITTTAENDGKLDQLAHRLTEDFRLEGRSFPIRIWGWGTLQDNIFKFRKAIDAFDPLHSPIADEIKTGLEKVHAGQQEQMERQDQNAELFRTVLNEIKAAVVQPTYLELDNSDAPDHAELDRYRTLINNGNPKAAILVIEAKQASLPPDASASVRSRLKALSAHCSWQLGNDHDAARLFREAAELAPEERRGIVAGILAAIVLGDYTTAFNSAVEALKLDPGNEAVAPWLIYAASRVANVDSPESFIPEILQRSQEYQEAYANFLRDKGRSPAWWIYARDGVSKYPESVVMRIASADSNLEEFIETSGFARTGQMSSEWRLRLQSAATTLAEVLNERNNSDNSSDQIIPAVACNLATLHGLLGDHDAALRVIEATLIKFHDDHDLLVRGAHITGFTDSKVIEDRCLNKLGDTGSDLLIKVLILFRRENWVELAVLADGGDFNSIEGSDGSMARLMAETAKIRTLRKEIQESAFETLLNDYRDPDEQLVVVASTAASLGLKNIAAMAFDRAKATLSPESHIASRLNLATTAENRDDWNAVIDALDGYLDLNANTRELRMLGRAFANAHPISDRALRFFENLPLELKYTSPYPYMAGLAIFKAGLPEKALPLIEAERMTQPNAANILLSYIQILLTLRKEEDVTSMVSELDPASLQGSGSELMKIAHVIKRFGSFSVALDFGYRLLRKHDNIPEIELLYCGLLLEGSKVDSDLLSQECVCDGMWIKIVDQDTKSDDFIIDSSGCPSANIVFPNDARASQFIGKKIGDTVEIERPLIGPRTWKILEIKHRYVHALHEIMGTFNNRFPGHRGLQEISIQDNNFQTLLDMLKNRAEKADSLGNAYESSKVPIALIGASAGSETIGFLGFLEARPGGIRTCYGAGEEHRQGLRFVEGSRGQGGVLDITALWTALRLDALPILSRVFGSIVVANSTVNEIREIREQRFQDLGKQVGTLVYKDGSYLSSGFNDSHKLEQFEIIDGYLAQVESLTIAPAVISHGLRGPLVDILTDVSHPHLIDPILVSAGSQVILLSEDVDFRNICKEVTKKQSVWLQPVFRYALEVGLISDSEYAVLTEKIILLGHGHVSLDARTLIAIADERPSSMPTFAKFIGGKDAEIRSHVAVVTAFARNYWTGSAVPNPIQKAMKVLLSNLLRFRESDRETILATIAVTACDDDGLLRFVVQWAMNRRWKTRGLKRLTARLRKERRR